MKKFRMWLIIVAVIIALVIIFVPIGSKKENESQPDKYRTSVIPVPEQKGSSEKTASTANREQIMKYSSEQEDVNVKEMSMEEAKQQLNNSDKAKKGASDKAKQDETNKKSSKTSEIDDESAMNLTEKTDNKQTVVSSSTIQGGVKTSTSAPAAALHAWAIQVGSFTDEKNAMELINRLKNKQYHVFSKAISTEKGKAIRVYVGPELQQALVVKLQADLSHHESINGVIVAYQPVQNERES